MVPVSFIQFSYWLWSQTGPSFDPAQPKAAASTGFSVFSCQNFFRSCGLVKKWCLTHAGFHEKRDVSGKASPKNSQSLRRSLTFAHLTEGGLSYCCKAAVVRIHRSVEVLRRLSAKNWCGLWQFQIHALIYVNLLNPLHCALPVWTRMVWPEPVGSRIGICGDSDSKLSRSAFV